MFELTGPIVALAAGAVVTVFKTWLQSRVDKQKLEDLKKREDAYEQKEIADPARSALAWDLARAKLESYLDRNLSQLRSILWLTYLVMIAGFVLITWGIYRAFDGGQNAVTIAVVGSASGVLISFIGGSFLVIYRSIMAQTKDYVAVMERINAVGMAVQVLNRIPDEHGELRSKTTADLAKDLIRMYGDSPARATVGKKAPTRR